MLTLEAFRRFGRALSNRGSRGSPRILVVGGQQDAAVAHAIVCLVPEAAVTVVSAYALAGRRQAAKRILAESEHHDVMFVSADLPPLRDGGTLLDLQSSDRLKLVPTISFSAFHPDQIRLGCNGRGPILGPAGSAHSALVLFGYCSAFTPKQVIKLFQDRVFDRVGYFDAWDASVDHLRRLGVGTGLDVDAALARWTRRGCFMHSANHIKPYVAVDLARDLLGRSGIAYHDCNVEDFIPADPGRGESWPVYPQIAAHYGVPGSALFQRPPVGRDASRAVMSLASFVAESFAMYDRLSPPVLACRRVERWRADAGLHAELCAIAEDA